MSSHLQGHDDKSDSDQQIAGFLNEQSDDSIDFGKERAAESIASKSKDGSSRRKGGSKSELAELVSQINLAL